MGKLVMGYWDCPYCENKGIRGDSAVCPSCGRPRGEVKFYMKNQAQDEERREDDVSDIEYVDEETAKHVNRNPDWYCSFCETLNSDNADTCRSCGASRADSEANYFQMLEKKREREAAHQQPVQQQPQKRSRMPMVLIALVLVIVGLFMFMNGRTTSKDYSISSVSWQRAIQIEQNRMFSESGWSVPSGGTVTSERTEIHHYDSVLDHYESYQVQRSRQVVDHYETYYTYTDLGNGMFDQVEHERPVYKTEYYTETEQRPVYVQVPRYATKYYYDIWRWTPNRQATAGADDHDPYWPDTNLAEDEREGQRAEVYRVTITNSKTGESARYRVRQTDWDQLKAGDSIYFTVKRSGDEPCISDEKGNPIITLTRDY
ncbi:MAG: hypothetical protein IJJ80_03180 [Clostridia bacterium]|nr:hypothetical protein [Clostridia bacterium]